MVEAERAGDDGSGNLQDELAQRRDPGSAQRQPVLAKLGGHGAVGGGLAGVPAGEQPVAAVVGGDVVVAGGGELVQQRAERRRDGAGRVAEPQPGLAVVAAGQVGGGEPQDAAERLGVEQHQARGGAGPDRDGLIGGEAAQQVEPALLGDDLPGVGLLAGDVQVAGKVANGITTVHLAYADEGTGHALITARQWIPRKQMEDPARRKSVMLSLDLAFCTKGQLAIDLIGEVLADGIKLDFACRDEVYGSRT